jgi:hypothetical protein
VEPVVQLLKHTLLICDSLVDRLYHHCKQSWVFEPVVLVLNLALNEREQLFVVVNAFSYLWILPHIYKFRIRRLSLNKCTLSRREVSATYIVSQLSFVKHQAAIVSGVVVKFLV